MCFSNSHKNGGLKLCTMYSKMGAIACKMRQEAEKRHSNDGKPAPLEKDAHQKRGKREDFAAEIFFLTILYNCGRLNKIKHRNNAMKRRVRSKIRCQRAPVGEKGCGRSCGTWSWSGFAEGFSLGRDGSARHSAGVCWYSPRRYPRGCREPRW